MKKVTLFVLLIVAVMLLVATAGAITLTTTPKDEKYPMPEATTHSPNQEAADFARNHPNQEAADFARKSSSSHQAPLDSITVISGIGIAGTVASYYRYRRSKISP